MKNKKDKCCTKMSGTNIFIGLLIGLTVLVFGGKMILNNNKVAAPATLNSTKVDKMIDEIKNVEKTKTTDFSGTWSTADGKLTLNADGTVSDMEGVASWKLNGTTLTLTNADETTSTMEVVDGNLVSGETVYKK